MEIMEFVVGFEGSFCGGWLSWWKGLEKERRKVVGSLVVGEFGGFVGVVAKCLPTSRLSGPRSPLKLLHGHELHTYGCG